MANGMVKDFREIFFDDKLECLQFVDDHWERVFNISHSLHADAGLPSGWRVRFLVQDRTKAAPSIGDILGVEKKAETYHGEKPAGR